MIFFFYLKNICMLVTRAFLKHLSYVIIFVEKLFIFKNHLFFQGLLLITVFVWSYVVAAAQLIHERTSSCN